MKLNMAHLSSFQQPAFRQKLDQCIHCGLCLQACPTYNVLQLEMDSPRGRIALLRAAADGRLAPAALAAGVFQEHIDLCLGCRACETACPSGVQYGLLLETARAVIAERQPAATPQRAAQWAGLRELLPHRGRLRRWPAAWRSINAWDWTPWPAASPSCRRRCAPCRACCRRLRLDYPAMSRPAPALGVRRGRVAFFAGCIQDAFLAGVNAATIRVLQRNGYEVHFPAAQTCCGAASLHTGDQDFARTLARRNIDAFAGGDYDAIVNNAGGCGATLKEYDHLLADDPRLRWPRPRLCGQGHGHQRVPGRAPAQPAHRRDAAPASSILDSCHLRHGQKVFKQPRATAPAHPRPGVGGAEPARPVLRQRRHLQPRPAGHGERDSRPQDGRPSRHRRHHRRHANTGCHMQMLYGRAHAPDSPAGSARRRILDLSYERHLTPNCDRH